MRLNKWKRPSVERLEDRWVPASFTWIGSGSTLILTQTSSAIGQLTITDNVSSVTVLDSGDGSTATVNLVGFNNLTVNLISSDTTLVEYDLTATRTGNVTLNISNASARTLTFNPGGNTIGGNLTITGGNGGLTVNETSAVTVAGNATLNGGLALDTFNPAGSTVTVGGNLNLNKFNIVALASGSVVGGTLNFNDSGEFTANTLTLTDTTVGSSLLYTGGSNTDFIALNGASVVGGNMNVNFGTQTSGTSSLGINGASQVAGSVTVTGGNLGTQSITLGTTATVNGSAAFNLGNATNTVRWTGIFTGATFYYTGGASVDTITYTPAAGSANARFTASLGASNDSVTFGSGAAAATNPSFAYIDFGAGLDSVLGTINFPFIFLNLP
jgi:hypothetical protein